MGNQTILAGRRLRFTAAVVLVAFGAALLPVASVLAAPGAADSGDCPPTPFTDRDRISPVHLGNVDCITDLGIAQGFPDGRFGPAERVRRDQMASFLVQTLAASGINDRLPTAAPDRGFTDVGEANAHGGGINVLAAIGVTVGASDPDTYRPRTSLTRAQITSFALRSVAWARGVPVDELQSDTGPFTDTADSEHREAINGAAELGLVNGRTENRFAPHEPISRQQMASLLVNLLDFVDAEADDLPAQLDVDGRTANVAVGGAHTVTATVVDGSGAPATRTLVRFEVHRSATLALTDAGVDPVTVGTLRTDDDGVAAFSYDGPDEPGKDTVVACIDAATCDGAAEHTVGSTTVRWLDPPVVAITAPTGEQPASVVPGDDLEVMFTVGGDADYTISYRGDGDDWTAFPGDGASGVAGEGVNHATVTVPDDEAVLDLRVQATADDLTDEDVQPAAVSVARPAAPVAHDVTDGTLHETPVTITLDGESRSGRPLTYELVDQPADGSAALVDDGADVTYTPDPGFSGTDTFTYRVNDGLADSNVATVTVAVAPEEPEAHDVSASTEMDTPVVITLDADNHSRNPLTYHYSQPADGTVTGSGADVTYTPDPGFFGTDTFTYHVHDGHNDSNTATVTITVDPTPPMAHDLSASTDQDESVSITLSVDAPSGEPVTYAVVDEPDNGTVTVASAAGTAIYTPNPNFHGTDTFTYQANDGHNDSNVATVTVTVQQAVGAIAGTVTDADTGGEIDGADVVLLDDEAKQIDSTETGGDGDYALADVPVGDYTIEVGADGYEPESVENVSVVRDDTTVVDVALAPEAAEVFVYSVSSDRTLRALDVDGEQVWSFTGHGSLVLDVAVDADGYVYSGGGDDTLRKVDPSGSEVWSFTGHTDWVEAVAVDDDHVYTASSDGSVRKVDADTGDEVWSFDEPGDYVWGIDVDGDGNVFASDQDGYVYGISPTGDELWRSERFSDAVYGVAADVAGRLYAVAGNGHVYALDAVTGDELDAWHLHSFGAYDVAVDAHGHVYAAGENGLYKLDGATGAQEWRFEADPGFVRAVAVGADGHVYAYGPGRAVRKLDGDDASQVWEFTGHTDSVLGLAVNPGAFTVAGHAD